MADHQPARLAPWLMLITRPAFFLFFQLVIAAAFLMGGSNSAFIKSSAWWPINVLLTNVVTIILLIWLHRREGEGYLHYAHFQRETVWQDLALAILIFVGAAPLSILPGQWLAGRLFASGDVAYNLIFQPLPTWAGLLSLLMPITIAFSELPTYFGYVMPRLERQLNSGWGAWAIAGFFLAFQHIAAPAVPDWRFILYRLGMFIPFALYMGWMIRWRPRLFPYLMIGHALIDMTVVVTILTL
jgi:hypothetical protein